MVEPEDEHFPVVPEEKMKEFEREKEKEKKEEEEEKRREEREKEREHRREEEEEERKEREERRREREKKEREREEGRRKKEEYEEVAAVGLSIGAIVGIGILGIIALSLTGGGGQYQSPQSELESEWKPLTDQEIQYVKDMLY